MDVIISCICTIASHVPTIIGCHNRDVNIYYIIIMKPPNFFEGIEIIKVKNVILLIFYSYYLNIASSCLVIYMQWKLLVPPLLVVHIVGHACFFLWYAQKNHKNHWAMSCQSIIYVSDFLLHDIFVSHILLL